MHCRLTMSFQYCNVFLEIIVCLPINPSANITQGSTTNWATENIGGYHPHEVLWHNFGEVVVKSERPISTLQYKQPTLKFKISLATMKIFYLLACKTWCAHIGVEHARYMTYEREREREQVMIRALSLQNALNKRNHHAPQQLYHCIKTKE